MVTAGVVGATGYAGSELLRLLLGHPRVERVFCASHSYVGQAYSKVFPNFRKIHDWECAESDLAQLSRKCDVLFLALPHGIASQQVSASILEHTVVIDLGADFRMSDPTVYETWYKTRHGNPKLLGEAVYGLCEIHRQAIKGARLIANPGCYTTCSILTAAPLLAEGLVEKDSIIIDAKSGVSGAGRGEKLDSLFCECNESIKAYGVGSHRHTPEIEEQLSLSSSKGVSRSGVVVSFTPHLVPMNRGILATVYGSLKDGVAVADVEEAYHAKYGSEQFIRLLGSGVFPETRWVKGSNYCDIGFAIDQRTRRVVACGAIDNLVKGAAGQAVQNMNIVFGYKEDAALVGVPAFPM